MITKTKIKTIIYKVNRWLINTEPEDIFNLFKTAPSNYFDDKKLINRMNFYEDYSKRY